MSSFTALMALSATQTREAQNHAETILREKKRKEQQLRKQQEEREAKERELERKLRLKHFEDEKKEQERLHRREEEKKAREAALQKREEEQRNTLLYGPKKAAKASSSAWPTSTSGAKEAVKKRRLPDEDESEPVGGGLTREELRERKHQHEMRKLYGSSSAKRSSHSSAYSKHGRRLPGGAVDVSSSSITQDASSGKSIRERLAALPNTLTKLNTVKRDTRTIDEILQDRAKLKEGKVLDGDAAREFDDWFGTSKKKKEESRKTSPATRPSSAAANSGANTPASQSSTSWPTPVATSSSLKKASISAPKPIAAPKPTPLRTSGLAKSGPPSVTPKSAGPSKQTTSFSSKSALPKISKNGSSAAAHHRSSSSLKRPRSDSRSISPPPHKRRTMSPDLGDDISQEIWKMFGRDRNKYVTRDVMSDDEDMEVDARILEHEEKISAKVAKKEDLAALEEERRHEEEKRRRKKERDRMLARGS